MQNLLTSAYIAAENKINLQPGGDFNTVQGLEFGTLIGALLKLILVVASLVFFFILVMGGINWILSGGDKAKTEGARNQITAALVGLVIVFSAWAIIQLIYTFFGVNILELTIPSAV